MSHSHHIFGGGPPEGGPPGGHHPPPHLQSHESSNVATVKGTLVKIFTEADKDFNMAVEHGKVVVAKSNDSDPHQQWIKDESWGNKAKDSSGSSAFALVNKGTGRALTRPKEAESQLFESTYYQNSLNDQVLWTLGKDEGHGYHALRPVSNIHLNLDIDHGSKKYGGIKDGQAVILFTWKGEDNQKWQLKAIGAEHGDHHHHFHL